MVCRRLNVQESVTTDAECEGLKHVTGGDVLITGAGWALGREQVNTFAFVKEFRDVRSGVSSSGVVTLVCFFVGAFVSVQCIVRMLRFSRGQ